LNHQSTSPKNSPLKPFLKWAGGKRWLVESHQKLLPTNFKAYYEPFLGSGAIYFSIQPETAFLSDVNKELIDCYIAVQEKWEAVEDLLRIHHLKHSNEYYYMLRSQKPKGHIEKAARFIYLNRTCWNGLYRVNLKGEFNVPKGTKNNVLLGTDNFEGVANLLKTAHFQHGDFAEAISKAQKDDFIFVDPPYTVKHNFNGFVKYNETMFHWNDQVRLSKALIDASSRGVMVLMTNANHPSIVELYQNDFSLLPISRSSVIAASSANRGMYEELIITNYLKK